WELREQQLIATHTGEIVHVAGLRHSDRRVNEQIRFNLFCGAKRELDVRPVHRVSSLEGNDTAPSESSKLGPQFRRSESKAAEIVGRWSLRAFDSSADVPRIRFVDGVIRARMHCAGAAEHGLRLGLAIGLPDVFNVQHRQHYTFGIAQGYFAAAGF